MEATDNGTASELLLVSQSPSEGTLMGTGLHLINLTVADQSGNASTCSLNFQVLDRTPPNLSAITAPSDAVRINAEVDAEARVSDNCAPANALWDWGDGSTSTGQMSERDGDWEVSGRHTYTSTGLFTVSLAVIDTGRNLSQVIHQYVIVYSPDGGSVTGAGSSNSSPGAYPNDPRTTGKQPTEAALTNFE